MLLREAVRMIKEGCCTTKVIFWNGNIPVP